jgi:phosphatidylethanolamine-binding protein (PEBP) family uncharacterized protein
LPKRRADCHHLVAKLRAFKATAAALFSHRSCFRRTSVPKASAKLRLFFIPSKFFNNFFHGNVPPHAFTATFRHVYSLIYTAVTTPKKQRKKNAYRHRCIQAFIVDAHIIYSLSINFYYFTVAAELLFL